MKVVEEHILYRDQNNNQLVAEVVEDLTPEERKDFKEYTLVEIPELSDEFKENLSKTVYRYIHEFGKRSEEVPISTWLKKMLKEDLPELSDLEIAKLAQDTVTNVVKAKSGLDEARAYEARGISSEDYFALKMSKNEHFASLSEEGKQDFLRTWDEFLRAEEIEGYYKLASMKEDSSAEYGYSISRITSGVAGAMHASEYINNIDKAIEDANKAMRETVLNKDGNINMNPNLDGFIAEQYHANTFNVDAAVKDVSDLVAEALQPEGEAYAKNSVDVVIKEIRDNVAHTVKKYQVKYGKDWESTLDYFNDTFGEYKYKFQSKLVPKGMADKATKTVDHIEYKGVKSKALSKDDAKLLQNKAQKGDLKALELNYKNSVETTALLKSVGNRMVNVGIMSAVVGTGLHIGKKWLNGEEIKAEEVVDVAITTGSSAALSCAVVAGTEVAIRRYAGKKLSKLLLGNNIVANVVVATIEILHVLYKMGTGKISFKDGLGEIATILTATYVGFMAYGGFATIAASIGIVIAIGSVAAIVGGTLLAAAGAAVVYACKGAIKTVVNGAVSLGKTVVKAGYNAVKSVVKAGYSIVKGAYKGVKSVGRAIGSGLKAIGRGIASFCRW